MEKKEFGLLAAALKTYYPKEQILPNQQAMELWYRELQDIPFPVAEAALRKWVSTQKWSPSIAELREAAAEIVMGETQDWGESWEKVLHAVRRFGIYNEAKAMESFDPMTRLAVERLGFRNVCLSENISAERANFRMIYETIERREKQAKQLGLPLQDTIRQLQSRAENNYLRLEG